MTVFVLQHVRRYGDDEENVKFIGVYSSQSAADSAIRRLSIQPGFKDSPDGFAVDEYEIDKDHWCEGFGWD